MLNEELEETIGVLKRDTFDCLFFLWCPLNFNLCVNEI